MCASRTVRATVGGGSTVSTSHFPLPTSHFELPASNLLRTSTSDFKLPTSQLRTSNVRLQTFRVQYQKSILALTCVCLLDVTVLLIRPNVASGASPSDWPANARSSGTPKLARFWTLNPSRRNSTRVSGPSAAHRPRLLNARSSVRRLGPVKSPRPVLPNVPAGCRANAAGLNHCAGVPLIACSASYPGA